MKRVDEKDIDLDLILKHLVYDSSSKSGFRRKHDWRCGKDGRILRAKAGDEAGSISESGYWSVYVDGKHYLAHRIIAKIHGLEIKDKTIDHINGDTSDNTPTNLRVATRAVNSRNRKMPNTNTSGIVGVSERTETRGNNTRTRFVVQWRDSHLKTKCKYFSSDKYGYEEAYRMACNFRLKMIEQRNKEGAEYTERHGT